MAWFRWHEGSVTDAKFQYVAHKSEQPVAFVVAVWAMLLERASSATVRGEIEGFDCDCADIALGMPEGAACAILAELVRKELVIDGRIAKWEERQPKREDENSTERVREYRARQKAEKSNSQCNDTKRNETLGNAVKRGETQCNDTKRNETLDKIRVDNIKEQKESVPDSFCAEPQGCSTREENADEIPDADLSSQSEPDKSPSALAPVICLPLNSGAEHPVCQGEIEQWQDLYPAVDVAQQLRSMKGWLNANPAKRKTKRGINRFIHHWLADKQDKGGNARASPQRTPQAPNRPENAARETWNVGQRYLARHQSQEGEAENG